MYITKPGDYFGNIPLYYAWKFIKYGVYAFTESKFQIGAISWFFDTMTVYSILLGYTDVPLFGQRYINNTFNRKTQDQDCVNSC